MRRCFARRRTVLAPVMSQCPGPPDSGVSKTSMPASLMLATVRTYRKSPEPSFMTSSGSASPTRRHEAYPSPGPMSRWLLGGLGVPVEGSYVNCPVPIRLITSRSCPAGRCCPVIGRVLRLRRPALWPSDGGVPCCRRRRPRRPGLVVLSRHRSSIGRAGPVGFRSPG